MAPSPVDEAAQFLEQPGHALNLIQNHELVFVYRQVERWIGQLCPVRVRFEVEIVCLEFRETLGSDMDSEGSLAGSARVE